MIEKLKSIINLKTFVSNNSSIFIDIDETIVTSQTSFIFGNPKCEKFIQNLENKLSKENMIKVRSIMEKMYYTSEKRLVDPKTPIILDELSKMGCKIFGITGNSFQSNYSQDLRQKLIEFGIRFTNSESNYHEDALYFVDGIFYASSINKGHVIKVFFSKHASYEPTQVILIDDSVKKCEKAQKSLQNCNFQVKILNYTASEDFITQEGMNEQLSKIMSQIQL